MSDDDDWKQKSIDNVTIYRAKNGWQVHFEFEDEEIPIERHSRSKVAGVLGLLKEMLTDE